MFNLGSLLSIDNFGAPEVTGHFRIDVGNCMSSEPRLTQIRIGRVGQVRGVSFHERDMQGRSLIQQ